jgi:hypothetical protein
MRVWQRIRSVSASPSSGSRHLRMYIFANHLEKAASCIGLWRLLQYHWSIVSGVAQVPEKYSHDEFAIGPPATARKPGCAAAVGIAASLARQNISSIPACRVNPASITVRVCGVAGLVIAVAPVLGTGVVHAIA